MADDTVFANGKAVATKGTDHVAVNEGEPDVLLVPPKQERVPTRNKAEMAALVGGSQRTFYADASIWILPGELAVSKEEAPQPAGSVGAQKGLPYRGVARCLQGSPDVFVEGQPVVRHHDPTLQDGGNSNGKVLKRAEADALQPFAPEPGKGKEGDGGAGKKGGGAGGGRKPKARPEPEPEPPPEPEPEKLPPPTNECRLDRAVVKCAHGGSISKQGAKIEVVAYGGGDTMSLGATVSGPCADAHRQWTIVSLGAAPITSADAETTFKARHPQSGKGESASLTEVVGWMLMKPNVYEVSVKADQGLSSFEVHAYPGPLRKFTVGEDCAFLAKLSEALDEVEDVLGNVLGGKAEISLFKGTASLSAVWKERRKGGVQKAYCQIDAKGAYKPMIGAGIKWYIPWGPLTPLQRVLQKIHVDGGPYAKVEANINLDLGLWARPQLTEAGGEAMVEGCLGIGIGLDINIGDPEDIAGLSVGVEAMGSISMWGKLMAQTDGSSLQIMAQVGSNLNPLSAKCWVTLSLGLKTKWFKVSVEVEKEWTFEFGKKVEIFTLTQQIWPTS